MQNAVVGFESQREFTETIEVGLAPILFSSFLVFFSFLKGLCSCFRRERAILIRDAGINTRNDLRRTSSPFASAVRISLELFKGAT